MSRDGRVVLADAAASTANTTESTPTGSAPWKSHRSGSKSDPSLTTPPELAKFPIPTHSLRMRLYLVGLVGLSWPTLVSGCLDLALLAL